MTLFAIFDVWPHDVKRGASDMVNAALERKRSAVMHISATKLVLAILVMLDCRERGRLRLIDGPFRFCE